jgi:hypothetical protein
MKITYLYAKQHRLTGLRYFGKTTAADPYKYPGSGRYWKAHCKKHGYDIITTWVQAYDDQEILEREAIFFSKVYNIVASDEWANLIEEDGKGGGGKIGVKRPDFGNFNKSRIGKPVWNTGKTGVQNAWNKGKKHDLGKKLCSHCNKFFGPGNFKQWHGDNCKHK